MPEWVNAAEVSELLPGQSVVVDVDDVMVAVFNIDGEFYAIEDVCTHDGSEIASGCIHGDEIECPRHGARFSIKTGEVTAPPAYEPVDTFPVQVVNEVVQVRDDRWD
jgi:3-phenylpropionate/trans-cinnamate dioxygenase ferredoxin subunit